MKRFTETTKWTAKPWFRKLPCRLKCLWMFFVDTCDNAGVIEPDWDMISMAVGEPCAEDDLAALAGRVTTLPNGRLWIPKFIAFQVGPLSPACKAHAPIYRSIAKNNLPIGDSTQRVSIPFNENDKRVSHTLKEEEKDKETEQDRKGVQGETHPASITAETIVSAYPRREDTERCLLEVTAQLKAGHDPESILAGTRAMAAAISLLPSGHLNKYVIGAYRFFRDKRWLDDPATLSRQGASNGAAHTPANVGGRKGTVVKLES